MVKLLRTYLKTLQFFSTDKAAHRAFEIFQTTAKSTIRDRERKFYQTYSTAILSDKYGDFKLVTNNVDSSKVVFLIHGWNSNAGSLQDIAAHFDKENVKFYAFNLPGHGDDLVRKSNIFSCKERVKFVLDSVNLSDDISFVSHSFGSAVISYALSEINIDFNKLTFLTSPNSLIAVFEEYGALMQLNKETVNKVLNKGSDLIGEDARKLTVVKKLNNINFKELRLIHDEYDKVIPYKHSLKISESDKNVKLSTYQNIGHYRMLSNEKVLDEVIKFTLD